MTNVFVVRHTIKFTITKFFDDICIHWWAEDDDSNAFDFGFCVLFYVEALLAGPQYSCHVE